MYDNFRVNTADEYNLKFNSEKLNLQLNETAYNFSGTKGKFDPLQNKNESQLTSNRK